MKVVLFCGGLGTRLREFSETIPKPMVPIGYRPILWNVMKYYAHYGHKDFILCLGYKGDMIKEYFMNYKEYISNDFVIRNGGSEVELLNEDISDWTITLVDTGANNNIGGRLLAVKEHLKDEEVFLANYADGLTDAPLDQMVDNFYEKDAVASFLAYAPPGSFHLARIGEDRMVDRFAEMADWNLQINAGYFVLKQEIFSYLNPGEELVIEPFERLIEAEKLTGFKHTGFWRCMDTLKDKTVLDSLYASDNRPWEVWRNKTKSHQLL